VKIEYHEDVNAPAEFVYRRLTDVARHERQAQARGATVTRVGAVTAVVAGAEWDIAFDYRGRRREGKVAIAGLTPPQRIVLDASSGGLDIRIVISLVALSPRITRVQVSANLVARTITAKLLVQSLRLAHGSVTSRLQRRLRGMCDEIDTAYARRQADREAT